MSHVLTPVRHSSRTCGDTAMGQEPDARWRHALGAFYTPSQTLVHPRSRLIRHAAYHLATGVITLCASLCCGFSLSLSHTKKRKPNRGGPPSMPRPCVSGKLFNHTSLAGFYCINEQRHANFIRGHRAARIHNSRIYLPTKPTEKEL